jgi:anti-sigma regulatory factor (Ser/Thr protein kinase)
MSAPSEAQRVELASSDSSAQEARRFVHEVAGHLDASLLDDLLLVISELVTNSVVHGPGDLITVELAVLDSERVRGEVCDEGAPTPKQRVVDTGQNTPGGFGLMLVDRLTSRWGIRNNSTHVWFELGSDAARVA